MQVLSMAVLPGYTYDAYSYTQPDATPGTAFLGGWATQAEVGPDILYETQAGQTNPTPLVLTNLAPYPAHQNDPTVVAPTSTEGADRSGWIYMYYTSLPNTATTLDQLVNDNQVGFASATIGANGQVSAWTYLGIVLPNAWSPSALQQGNQIDMFYNTGGSNFADFVTHLNENGWQQNGTSALVDMAGHALQLSNLDVIKDPAGGYLMVGNWNGNLGQIAALRSTDEIHWAPAEAGSPVIIQAASGTEVLTPEIHATATAGEYDLYFTQTVGLNANGTANGTATMHWTIGL